MTSSHALLYGMDRRWKRLGFELAPLPKRPVVLDLASGTGDFSLLVKRQYRVPGDCGGHHGAHAAACPCARRQLTVCGDASKLPFPDESFDCVFVGYGLRNFPNLAVAVREMERVTRPGGLLVSLDFFLPSEPVDAGTVPGLPLRAGRFWGQSCLDGRACTLTYRIRSAALSIDEFSSLLRRTGYHRVDTRRYILGGIGLHWAAKLWEAAAGGGWKAPDRPLSTTMKERLRGSDYRFIAISLALLAVPPGSACVTTAPFPSLYRFPREPRRCPDHGRELHFARLSCRRLPSGGALRLR